VPYQDDHKLRARISNDLKSAGGFKQVSSEMSNPGSIAEQPLEAIGLRLGKKIGEGGHADVYESLYHGAPAAVKVLKQLGGAERSAFSSEIEVMKKLRHPHVIQVRRRGIVW
jgi:serine/threonine protein kinase